MQEMEDQFRMAIRDAVNRATRKPFYWGGLKGYRQLESIAQALHTMPVSGNAYFGRLIQQVDRVLEKNRILAETIDKAYTWLLRISACLHYPPRLYLDAPVPTRHQVKQDMQALLISFESEARGQRILLSLYMAYENDGSYLAATCFTASTSLVCPRTISRLKVFLGSCGLISVASAVVSLPNLYVILDITKSFLRQKVKTNFWSSFGQPLSRTTERTASSRLKWKAHANSLLVSIATQKKPCAF